MWAIFPVCVIETRSFGWRAFPRRTGAVQMARRFPQPYGAAFRAQPRLKDCRGVRRAARKGFPISAVRASMGGRDLLRESRGRPSPRRRPRTGRKGPSGDSSSRPYARNPDGFSGFLFCFRLDVCGRGHPPGQAAASAWSGTPGCAGWAATGPHGAWYAGRPATRWNREHAGKTEANPPAGETRNARSPDAERHPGSCVVGGGGACAPFPPGGRKG